MSEFSDIVSFHAAVCSSVGQWAVMELIVDGGYQTIDLSRFSFERFLTEDHLEEEKIV